MADPNPSEIAPEEAAIEGHVDKISTLTLLAYGGLTREELRKLPDVTDADIDKALKILKRLGR